MRRKNIIFIIPILILLIFQSAAYSQFDGSRFKKVREKIAQLEKIKLIDVLNMDENTTLKFFARRNQYQNKTDSLMNTENQLIDDMDSSIKSGDKSDGYYREQITKYFRVQDEIIKSRRDFIRSLNDLLSEEQIAKYIVFEKKFREDIRNLILKQRMRR